jgi:hypothetical protein
MAYGNPSQASDLNVFGPTLVYASTNGSEMSNLIEDNDQDQFAKGKTVAICESTRTPGNWRFSSWKR